MKINLHNTAVRISLLIVALVGVFCLFHFVLEPYMDDVDAYISNLAYWGPLFFIVIFIVATTLFFPEAVLALAAGAIFGVWWGLLWVTIGGVLATLFMFIIGRHLIRRPVTKLLTKHPKLQAFNESVSTFKMITVLRLSPFNFTALSYLASISTIKFTQYVYASIAMIPGFLSTTYIGYAAKHSADLAKTYKATGKFPAGDSIVHELTVYGGMVVAVSVSLVVARIALKTIKNLNSS